MDEECFICYTNICDVHISCGHSLCKRCLQEIINRSNYFCPFCKQLIREIQPMQLQINRSFVLGNGKYAGLTLCNTVKGVTVKHMNFDDEASKHLKIGDVITNINGISAVHHYQVVNIINYCTENNKQVFMHIKSNFSLKESVSKWLKRWTKTG